MTNREIYKFENFTIEKYTSLVKLAINNGFDFIGYKEDYLSNSKQILWRHDVEFSPFVALEMAQIEADLGVKSTYFFQLHGELYNTLEKEVSLIVHKIKELGHDIGLHFDSHYFGINDEKELSKFLRMDADYFENIFGYEITVFSFHNTNKFTLSCDENKYAGILNVYSKYLKSNFEYCADSTGFWRYENLEDVLKNPKVNKLQVLTHDSMWSKDILSPRQRVFHSIDENAKRQKKWYDHTLFEFGAKNIDSDEMFYKTT
jgi:hypothetical protein